MFDTLDSFLIARLFQPVVDLSQRKPIWWSRQAGIASLLLIVAHAVGFGWHAMHVVTLLPLAIQTWLFTSVEAAFLWLGQCLLLRMLVVCLLFAQSISGAYMAWHLSASLEHLIAVVLAVLNASFLYFAACRTPAPRKHRTEGRLDFQPGAT